MDWVADDDIAQHHAMVRYEAANGIELIQILKIKQKNVQSSPKLVRIVKRGQAFGQSTLCRVHTLQMATTKYMVEIMFENAFVNLLQTHDVTMVSQQLSNEERFAEFDV